MGAAMSAGERPAGQRVRLGDLPAEWRRVSPYRGALDLAAVWSGLAVLAALSLRSGSIPAVLVALPLIGALQNHLSSLGHHAIHGNLHPRRAVNDWMARLLITAPLGMLLGALRGEHMTHHARFGEADDPERIYYDLSRHGRATPAGLLAWMARVLLTGWIILPAVRRLLTGDRGGRAGAIRPAPAAPAERRERLLEASLIPVVQAVLAMLFWALSGVWWAYLVVWLLPVVTVGGGLTVIRATLEHADRTRAPLLLSFVSNPIERFFVSPFNFNYHYEHHRFMSVPYYRVAGIRDVLLQRDDYDGVLVPSYWQRVGGLVRELRG